MCEELELLKNDVAGIFEVSGVKKKSGTFYQKPTEILNLESIGQRIAKKLLGKYKIEIKDPQHA